MTSEEFVDCQNELLSSSLNYSTPFPGFAEDSDHTASSPISTYYWLCKIILDYKNSSFYLPVSDENII